MPAINQTRHIPMLPSANTLRRGLFNRLAVWRTRRALARLDARGLDDVGISPKDAAREASRGFWDVPATWRCMR